LQEVQSTEFPDGAVERIEKANVVFKQLIGLAQTAGVLLIPGVASQILEAFKHYRLMQQMLK